MKLVYYRLLFFFLAGNFLPIHLAQATHLRAGEITVKRKDCTSLTFIITITVYTNTGSSVKFSDGGTGLLSFNDGVFVNPKEMDGTPRPDLGPDIGVVTYTTEHTFTGPGQYKISYLEANRNSGILNIFDSVNTRFYLETIINIDPFLGCDNSPKLLVPPIDKACTGAAWFHNPGAYDPDGDSLSFQLIVPRQEKDREVNNYRPPNTKDFYDRIGLNYDNANETQNGKPTFSINPQTGTILWDSPGAPGQYNIAFLIISWRKIAGTWINLGSVTRDMQIIVEDCKNKRPKLEPVKDVCVEAGKTINQDVFGFDPDSDSVKIEAFSQVFSMSPSPATWSLNPPKFQSSGPSKMAVLKFQWNTKCEHIKEQPYQVVFKISDRPKPNQGPTLVQFITWNIRVVAPAPKWSDAQIDLNTRSANLKWNPYTCQQAEKMQVWRRVDKFEYTPPECVTGIPEYLGFTKIAEVPIAQSQYKDTNNGKGLAVGAQYCYRLVAVFPLPGGGESYVSRDTCLLPILADAPVVTHVTVDKTNKVSGQITVKWRSPFDISKAQFPPPYTYEVYRAEGFSGIAKIIKPHTGKLVDSVYVDAGINTTELVYNYRIVCYDSKGTKVDTSSVASSVRLETKSQLKKIQLTWSFDVPWSNNTQDYPKHLIYRGSPTDTEAQMTLIASVDVNAGTYTYLDEGQYNNTPLDIANTYCYRVMTQGAYGNPKIDEPLLNFSQIICAQPVDSDPPCKPQISVKGINCEEFIQTASCNPTTFSNTLTWNKPTDATCRADIRYYKIYLYANSESEKGTLLATNVSDTFFIHSNIPSYAMCYKVTAVDRSDNESELSEMFCFDNCPYYELPNVFTPNGDQCNEVFSAYSDREIIDEGGQGQCGPVDPLVQRSKCARFVQKVHFTVVNRWGKQVYDYTSGNERSIYIDWNGRDNNGKELSTGIYYYVAEVTFDVVNPSQRNQTIKGWVHLIR